MIFQTPPLGEPEFRTLARIAEIQRSLTYAIVTTPGRWQGALRRSSMARAVRASNTIEGYDIAVDDAAALGVGEPAMDASADTVAAVLGYQGAMTYVLQLAADPHFAYSTALLRALHFIMLQHDLRKNPGRWRPGPTYVRDDVENTVVYEGPPAEAVPSLCDELVQSLGSVSTEAPPLVRAAMAHLNLVMIHPFSDGNGRMARCLQSLVLARAGTLAPQFCSIEEYLGDHTQDYYRILADVGAGAWSPDRDALPWVRFALTAHERQATTILRRTREIERLWGALERELQLASLPERLILALADAANGWRIRNATYRALAEVTDQVAGRDLAAAVSAGLLVANGERRGRHYVASPALLRLRDANREPATSARGVPGSPAPST